MCCCEKPTINGQPGYRWQPKDQPSSRPVNPPTLTDEETLIYDEPGRCGGVDAHSHHYRLVLVPIYGPTLLVRHGGGDQRIHLSNGKAIAEAFASLDSNSRYWIMSAIHSAYSYAYRHSEQLEASRWRQAAAEKRLKIRKVRGENQVKVWIETRPNEPNL